MGCPSVLVTLDSRLRGSDDGFLWWRTLSRRARDIRPAWLRSQ